MLWSSDRQYGPWPFEHRSELQAAILDARAELFGPARAYMYAGDSPANLHAAPDAYVIDLSSASRPLLYLVQIDLVARAPLRHIAQRLLDGYLSTRTMPKRLLSAVHSAVVRSPTAAATCEAYAISSGYASVDAMLQASIATENVRGLVILDDDEPDLERGLRAALRFPIEVLTFRRFRSASGETLFAFDPFLRDLVAPARTPGAEPGPPPLDPIDIDTLVVPAREEGLKEVFLNEQMWGPVSIPESMLSRIRFIAAYQVAPVSAITHIAEVERIEPWGVSSKYAVYFKAPAQTLGPIPARDASAVRPTGNRYTSFARLCRAHALEDAF